MLTAATENREQQVANNLRKMQNELEEMAGQIIDVQQEYRQRIGVDNLAAVIETSVQLLNARLRIGAIAGLIDSRTKPVGESGQYHGVKARQD
jgi:hypothetical protein